MKAERRSILLRAAGAAARGYLVPVALFSLAINLLYLASPLYMMQIYGRVITSGSVITLVLLSVILVIALVALSSLDIVRGWIMSRLGLRLDQLLATPLLAAAFRIPGPAGGQLLRDFDTFRHFLASGSAFAIFDLPWVPVYIVAAYLLHPWFGLFTLACCALLLVFALVNEWLLVAPLRAANEALIRSQNFADTSLRNAEVVQAMGMIDAVSARWHRERGVQTDRQALAATWSLGATGVVKFFRLAMQSLILGLGAYLTIERQVGAGAMFAATFLLGRGLQPIEQIVAGWRQVVAARLAWVRVRDVLNANPEVEQRTSLPRPQGAVAIEGVNLVAPNGTRPILRAISLSVTAGETTGIVGPSGAGKSSLVRVLVGVVRPTTGIVRLDGADIQTYPADEIGAAFGYLPQDVELFADTVAANISRFQPDSDEDVIRAAELAGVHETILKLPQGYNTQIGASGELLSGGYRQRIGLARAVFGDPSVVVLDEPSSNLDSEGDLALARCLQALKRMGTTVFIVSHRPTSLSAVDRILLMRDGMIEAFGPRDEVAARIMPPRDGAVPRTRPKDTVDG
jgi:PrtD family type I secretion system ABC transporter